MELNDLFMVLLPALVAVGSALVSIYMMQARMEVALAKEREQLSEARAIINTHKATLEERTKATTEETRRRALDDFMQEFRVEERHYVRENRSVVAQRKSMVMRERLFFRNIPLSNWVEHELLMEENTDIQSLAQACSVFGGTKGIAAEKSTAMQPFFKGKTETSPYIDAIEAVH